jgi:hypothetical protein
MRLISHCRKSGCRRICRLRRDEQPHGSVYEAAVETCIEPATPIHQEPAARVIAGVSQNGASRRVATAVFSPGWSLSVCQERESHPSQDPTWMRHLQDSVSLNRLGWATRPLSYFGLPPNPKLELHSSLTLLLTMPFAILISC